MIFLNVLYWNYFNNYIIRNFIEEVLVGYYSETRSKRKKTAKVVKLL